jgi:hypothetical protein
MSGDGGDDDDKKKRAALRARPGRVGEYEVGYGKPPEQTRFKKGRSGNPKGRPKGSKTKPPDHDRLAAILLEEAYREVPLREGGREVNVPMAVAVVRGLFVKGARGTARSAQVALEMLRTVEDRKRQDHQDFLETVINYKTEWEMEIADRKARGEPEPELDIHPDQIVPDVATGEVHLKGPLTKEDRQLMEGLRKRKEQCEAELDWLKAKLKRARKPEVKESIRQDIANCEKMLAIIRPALPVKDPVEVFRRQMEQEFPTKG